MCVSLTHVFPLQKHRHHHFLRLPTTSTTSANPHHHYYSPTLSLHQQHLSFLLFLITTTITIISFYSPFLHHNYSPSFLSCLPFHHSHTHTLPPRSQPKLTLISASFSPLSQDSRRVHKCRTPLGGWVGKIINRDVCLIRSWSSTCRVGNTAATSCKHVADKLPPDTIKQTPRVRGSVVANRNICVPETRVSWAIYLSRGPVGCESSYIQIHIPRTTIHRVDVLWIA